MLGDVETVSDQRLDGADPDVERAREGTRDEQWQRRRASVPGRGPRLREVWHLLVLSLYRHCASERMYKY